jgi:tetratricopeptide (TPR) repeat protein
MEQGNIEKAVSICEEGIAKHPQYPFGHFILGICYYHKKDYPRAKNHLEISTGYDENNPRAWKLLAEINKEVELPILAEECNLKYFLLDPFSREAVEAFHREELTDLEFFWEGGKTGKEKDDTVIELDSKRTEQKVAEDKEFQNIFDEQLSESAEDGDLENLDDIFKETPPPPEKAASPKPEEKLEKLDKQPEKTEEKIEVKAEVKTQIPVGHEKKERETEEQISKSENLKEERIKEAKSSEALEKTEPTTNLETDADEELLDFRSVVEDIISEQKKEYEIEDDPKEKEEKLEQKDVKKVEDKLPETNEEVTEKPLTEDLSRETSGEEKSPQMTTEETEKMEEKPAHFGKPPILSSTIGEIYIAQGRFEEAIEVFQKLLEKEPDNQKYQRKIRDISAIIDKQKSQSS